METNHNDVDSNSQIDLDKNKKSSKPKKKSPKKTIKSSEKVLDSKSSFALLQSSYKNWMKFRIVSIELFQNKCKEYELTPSHTLLQETIDIYIDCN